MVMGELQSGTSEEGISLPGLHEAQPRCPVWGPGSKLWSHTAVLHVSFRLLCTSALLELPSQPHLCLKMGKRMPGCCVWVVCTRCLILEFWLHFSYRMT